MHCAVIGNVVQAVDRRGTFQIVDDDPAWAIQRRCDTGVQGQSKLQSFRLVGGTLDKWGTFIQGEMLRWLFL
jgi:hypothetical protein